MSEEAIRDVTIRLNVVRGNIEPINVTVLAQATQGYVELEKAEKSVVETQKEVASTAKAIIEQNKEIAKSIADVTEAAKQSDAAAGMKTNKGFVSAEQVKADHELALKIHAENTERYRKKDLELAAEHQKRLADIQSQPGGSGPGSPAFVPPDIPRNGRNLTEPGQENQQRRLQREQEAEAAAARKSIALQEEVAARMEQLADERVAAEEEANRDITNAEAQGTQTRAALQETLAQAQARSGQVMPRLLRQTQLDISQTIASTASFIAHLSMLKSIGGESLEGVAKEFAKIQSTVGLITSSQGIFNNMGEGLEKMRQMGAETQRVVTAQNALGIATTATQGATMRLAGAAGTLQAALGPISLIASAIMVAIVATEFAMRMFGESAEEVQRKQDLYKNRIKEMNDNILSQQKAETKEMSLQTAIMNEQYALKRLLLGEKDMSASQLRKESIEKGQQSDAQMQNAIRSTVSTTLVSDKEKAERERIRKEKERVTESMSDSQASYERNSSSGFLLTAMWDKSAVNARRKELASLNEQESQLNLTSGESQKQVLSQATVKAGVIEQFDNVIKALNTMPTNLKEQAAETLGIINSQQQAASQIQASLVQEARQSGKQAKSESETQAGKIKTEKERFETKELMASQFANTENDSFRQDAEKALTRFESATTPADKRRAADEAKQLLAQGNLLSPETSKLLSAARPNVGAIRAQITDDSEVTTTEHADSGKVIADATTLKMEADSIIRAMPRLVKELESKLQTIKDQQEMLGNAIQNWNT